MLCEVFMRGSIKYKVGRETKEREINYIPVRYIFAVLITLLEIISMVAITVLFCIYIPYFYIVAYITAFSCVLSVVASEDNPDYKVPWIIVIIAVPIGGFMLYFLFYSRKLQRKYRKRLFAIRNRCYKNDNAPILDSIKEEDKHIHGIASAIISGSGNGVYNCKDIKYYPLGDEMLPDMLKDLEGAKKFIFLEFFIIEEGKFWNSILEILEKKASEGVDVRVVYDDIGCLSTLPGNYDKILTRKGILATPFSRLRGSADGEFNNRSHRKILVIDGETGYTGGVNIADEYINERVRFGHWKDVGLRLTGECVNELTSLFLTDYGINARTIDESLDAFFNKSKTSHGGGYVLPYGDGPRPIYDKRTSKYAIMNMLSVACDYVYIMTPYLVIDNELCRAIENASERGVDIRIIMPHIPDKKLVFKMARGIYPRLIKAGVKMYEYEAGFVHAKVYLSDDKCAIVGTVNLDYRSLVHHFENAVFMYNCPCLSDIKNDFSDMLENRCIRMDSSVGKFGPLGRLFMSIIKIFAPLL